MAAGRRIRVRGQVQGVGFRPFIWHLARRMGLRGWVLNDPEGVLICVSGGDLNGFEDAIRADAPVLARVDAVEGEAFAFDPPEGFEIAASTGQGAQTGVVPDAATCPECLAEIRDPGDRRFGYAFANCTRCGPRFSILKALPYDRAQTTMAGFDMCPDCAAEYADPADRRFHAQPVACPACGPRLWLEQMRLSFLVKPDSSSRPVTARRWLRASRIYYANRLKPRRWDRQPGNTSKGALVLRETRQNMWICIAVF